MVREDTERFQGKNGRLHDVDALMAMSRILRATGPLTRQREPFRKRAITAPGRGRYRFCHGPAVR